MNALNKPSWSRRYPHAAIISLALTFAATVIFSSCTSHPAAPKRYHFTGQIMSIDTQDKSAVINGDNIPGFMDPMTMSYKIKPASTLSQLAAGDLISADVVVTESANSDGPSDYWLENVKVTGHVKMPLPSPGPGATQRMPQPGDAVPNFSFTNQDGQRVSLKQYHGKVLLLTFIYTRCPFPDFCPRVSENFAEIYKQIDTNPSLESSTRLLSLSFDPEYDTPKVLRDYAFKVAHTRDAALFRRWEFGVPRKDELPKIADFFGVIYKAEGGMITHNLSTTVIGPDGKIVKWYHGNDWQVSDLVKDAGDAEGHKG